MTKESQKRGESTSPASWGYRARERIQSGKIIQKLEKHILGEKKMSSTQVRAADILLKKCLPDLRSTEVHVDTGELSHEGWMAMQDAKLQEDEQPTQH